MSLLQVEGLRLTRTGQRIIDIPLLTLEPGDRVALRGPNGAGKSTLLRILAGLLEPDGATVSLDEHTGSWRRMRGRLRARTVYVHQRPYLFRGTVEDNVSYGLRWRVRRAERRRRVEEALAWAGLLSMRRREARSLSGGEAQRLALARARVVDPELLLLDEPTANLDTEHRAGTEALLQRLSEAGTTLVVATHDPVGPLPTPSKHWILRQGRLHVSVPGRLHRDTERRTG